MRKISAVIFDMDGLMLDTEKVYFKINRETASELGYVDFTADFYKQFIGCGDDKYREGIFEAFKNDELAERFLKLSNERLEEAFLDKEIDKKPGLIELLEYLQAEGITAIVASSTNRYLVDAILERTSIRKYFADVVGGDEVKAAKPAPDIFLKAAEYADCPKEAMIILEDSLNGVRAAYTAGIDVIMIPDILEPNDEAKEKAFAIFDDLHEVIDYLESV